MIVETEIGTGESSAETTTIPDNSGLGSQTQSDIEKGDVSPEFVDALKTFRQEAGLEKKPETPEIPKEEIVEKKDDAEEIVDKADDKAEEVKDDPESAEKKEGEEDKDDFKTPDGESVKATRISEVKDWGKGWQTTAEQREPAHKFIEERYKGNMEEAEISANLFEKVLGNNIDDFNPTDIFSELSELSKPRAEKLVEFFATNKSVLEMAEQRIIEQVFGKDLTAEELQEDLEGYKLFKQVGGLSALLGENGELPAQLQYDSDGNPKSEEEVNIYKTFLNELKGIKTDRQKEAEAKSVEETNKRQAAEHTAIESYTEERFDGVNSAIKQLGLEIKTDDSEEISAAKLRDSRMIKFYVLGMASDDESFKSVYTEAVNAIKSGDSITASRKKIELNAKIAGYTSEIVDDYIAKNNIKIDKSQQQIDKAKETKKEVALGGGDFTAKNIRPKNESVDDSINRLVKEGKLRSA